MTQGGIQTRGGGVCEWITLRRIRDQNIVSLGGHYYDQGILLGAHLAGTVRDLITEERVRPVQERSYFRLVLTPRGECRLAAMERLTMRRLRLARHG